MQDVRNRSYERGLKSSVDWRLVVCFLLIMLFGWVNIYAAVQSAEPSSIFDFSANSGKQAVWMGGALLLATLILFVVTPKIWEALALPGYGIVILLLFAVRFLGTEHKGSLSWFSFGPISFQPAEISKITTSLFLAAVMSRQNFKLSDRRDFIKAALIIALPMLAIIFEKETGSALVYVGFMFVLYREGMSGWLITMVGMAILLFILRLTTSWWVALCVLLAVCLLFLLPRLRRFRVLSQRREAVRNTILAFCAGAALILATGFIFNNVLQDHQRKRIEVLLGIVDDPRGLGYNVHQSMIAIGSGGFSGKGYLGGTQTTFGFVPEQSTDFIFCTVGEEWGFLGCLAVIVLYSLLIFWIVEDADKARESFTRIYGYCLASCLFMHLFINIGMTIGLMPIIGIPLPLFSYGGSSLWAFTVMIFIFIALNRQENKYF
ncbi:MAG: rod shape-determining protein RodA [Bacteroidales bacterium]|nr:rod shape-determining protein RodA [Bacteroidales bacterium]